MTRRPTRRRGFTLMEMLAVMWGLGIALTAGVLLVRGALDANKAAGAVADRTGHRSQLAERFRSDVAKASATEAAFNNRPAGPDRLILRRPDGGRVVYEWRENALFRVELPAGGKGTVTPIAVPKRMTVSFDRGTGDRPLATLRLTEPTAVGGRRSDVSAAVGGDLR